VGEVWILCNLLKGGFGDEPRPPPPSFLHKTLEECKRGMFYEGRAMQVCVYKL